MFELNKKKIIIICFQLIVFLFLKIPCLGRILSTLMLRGLIRLFCKKKDQQF